MILWSFNTLKENSHGGGQRRSRETFKEILLRSQFEDLPPFLRSPDGPSCLGERQSKRKWSLTSSIISSPKRNLRFPSPVKFQSNAECTCKLLERVEVWKLPHIQFSTDWETGNLKSCKGSRYGPVTTLFAPEEKRHLLQNEITEKISISQNLQSCTMPIFLIWRVLNTLQSLGGSEETFSITTSPRIFLSLHQSRQLVVEGHAAGTTLLGKEGVAPVCSALVWPHF